MAESSRPRSGMDLPTDITDLIADMLLEQKSLTYDERDIARDAAKCMLVGNPAFTTIGRTLYKAISPRLGHSTEGVSESSKILELKNVLKTWKLPLGGTKPELWKRIYDQVSVPEDCNDQLCPASTATRDFVRGLDEAMISQSKAKDVFNLSKNDLEGLFFEVVS
ncbi:hypothetical protein DUNSADRAFT_2954 [Dunaliella salina]|uniref:SAP domain-containing protein n=1 Tax=Dunaliella salina TaxID=3046 RepID=A0ABQ7FVS3_DUNSA|nr:hypothetical protein DUNSADRAFT_2954 [Dunaliella salina]|eukprot:KAF5826487.1 hypothetical protein DUNSADRAFT_2954 [Dunaliella salina]